MEVPSSWRVIWCTVWVWLLFPYVVHSAPISIDFSICRNATYDSLFPNVTVPPIACCPLLPTKPIIDGLPPPTTDYARVRMASQCTDADYAAKIEKAYALMRALPDDDPRSFFRQWELHCAYCGGSFLTYNSSGDANGIDIHFSWLFLPWHRYYLYFHERILQSLLGDPTFSLNYWNWDNFYSVGDGTSKDGVCLSDGKSFPTVFDNPSSSTYDTNRSDNAKGLGRLDFAGFQFVPIAAASAQPLANASADEVILADINVMYNAMVSGGTNAETFLGRPYRAGDLKGAATPGGGGGSLEGGPHPAVHFWTGKDAPESIDMGALQSASRDPVFYAHHGNIDRMWEVWKSIGPLVGGDHTDYTDSDFLDSEFLFYDENKDLRRVKVKDSLDTTKLGYVYQEAPIDQWLTINQTKCSPLNYTELVAAADCLPAPAKDSCGRYSLAAGETFNIEIERPNNTQGLEEFLTIDEVNMDRNFAGGFDVFVDLINPSGYGNPWKCPEYAGRFVNMATPYGQDTLVWKQSITRTFVDINATDGPSTVLISLVSLSTADSNDQTIYFTDINIDF